MTRALLIANNKHLHSDIKGGVQLCTDEFISLFSKADFELKYFPVNPTRNILHRLKIKLGIDVYQTYDAKKYINQLIEIVEKESYTWVIINQVNMLKFAKYLKLRFGTGINVICWSHGNESGDFLHRITRECLAPISRLIKIVRLGYTVYTESRYFIDYIDFMLVISGNEKSINQWLGTDRVLFIPRTYTTAFIDRKPKHDLFGFTGSLDHPPNRMGLKMLCDAIKKLEPVEIRIRVVGGPVAVGRYFNKQYSFIDYIGRLSDSQLENEISSWSYFLNPVFWYSRGASTKLAFAINKGIPVISTEAGNRGYEWSKGEIRTVKNPSEMAEVMIQSVDSKPDELLIREVAQSGPDISNVASELKKFLSIE